MATMEKAKELLLERDRLDQLIAEQELILRANGVDMNTALVDGQGYPSASLDIYAIRSARNAIVCAQNDRVKLTNQIEALMVELHSNAKEQSTNSLPTSSVEQPVVHRTSNRPFGKVDKVAPGSPAEEAGLRNGDLIVQFGSLHAENFTEMKQFSSIVRNSVGAKIRVTVLRSSGPARLLLMPTAWGGRGLLGCSLLPLTSQPV